MDATWFDTFVRAVGSAHDREGILGDDFLVFPPNPDYGYEATPRNAITFGAMGVDGVHYAILTIDGELSDDSPVIHVSPMDFSEPYAVLGESFINYLATACGVSARKMEAVFQDERAQGDQLVPFLKGRFEHSRLYEGARFQRLDQLLDRIEPKS